MCGVEVGAEIIEIAAMQMRVVWCVRGEMKLQVSIDACHNF
jgi:hypothetical protein